MQPPGQHRGDGQIRVHVAAGQPVLQPRRRAVPDQPDGAGAVVPAPADGGRCERAIRETLVGVDVRRVQQGEIGHGCQHTGDEVVVERGAGAGGVVPEDQRTVVPAQRQVDVAGVALPLVVLRHERDRLAVLGRDLLRGVLVDDVVVGGGQRIGVPERDLVLAEVALALRGLHHGAGRVHDVADLAQQRLDAGRAEDRVVDVVLVRRRHVPVVRRPGILVAGVEHDELQLGAGHRLPSVPGRPLELRGQDGARGHAHRRSVLPHQVALDHHGAGQVRQPAHRAHVEPHRHIAVAGLPRRDGVALDGVHLHVGGERVVAPLGAVGEDVREEEVGVDPLALQPSLHVRVGHDDGVHVAGPDQRGERLEGQQPFVAGGRRLRRRGRGGRGGGGC